jgi:1-acyl-sn-glycerol-3-phosphate acyltransferase
VLKDLCGTQLHFSSDENWEDLIKDGNIIILANRAATLDWIYASWCYGALIGRNADMRMILKDRLKGVPVFGWAMQILLYSFTKNDRNLNENVANIHKTFRYLLNTGEGKTSMLIFPESGGKKTLEDMQRIFPLRPSGFITCVDALREGMINEDTTTTTTITTIKSNTANNNNNNAVHDLTLSFRWRYGPVIPSDVFIHITRYPFDILPHTYDGLEGFFKNVF